MLIGMDREAEQQLVLPSAARGRNQYPTLAMAARFQRSAVSIQLP
jgi:hypothetical protein